MKFKRILATALVLIMLASSMSVFAQDVGELVLAQSVQAQQAETPASSDETPASSEAPSSSVASAPSDETSSSEETPSSEPASSESASSSEAPSSSDASSSEASSSEISSSEAASSEASSSAVSSEASSSSDLDEETADSSGELDGNVMAPNDITAFVTRLYQTTLDRSPDPEGLNYWVTRLTTGAATGATVMQGFFDADEYKAKNKSDEAFITDVYRAAFDRTPDPTGFADWTNRLSNFVSRNYVLAGFAGSNEFIGLCQNYGITSGNITLTESRDQNYDVTSFVTRLYKTTLDRTPDVDGLNVNTGRINNRTISAAALTDAFFESNEYRSKNKSDAQFITDLYLAMLNRTPDPTGMADWQARLNTGVSRAYIINGFAGSNDFRNLCNSYGIDSGNVTLTESRDQNINITAFVQSFYEGLLKRGGDVPGLNDWTGRLIAGLSDGVDVALGFINSNEMQGVSMSDDEYVVRMYNLAFNRNPSAAEISSWTVYLSYGCTRDYITWGFLNSNEFRTKCNEAGVRYHVYNTSNVCDADPLKTKFVNDFYRYIVGRSNGANNGELVLRLNQLNNGTYTGVSLAREMFGAQESRNYFNSITNNQKVTNLFLALFGRQPTANDIATWANYIAANGDDAFLKELLKQQEYKNYATSRHVTPGTLAGNLTVTANGQRITGDAIDILSHIVAGEVGSIANVEVFRAQAIAAHSWILYENRRGNAAPEVSWGTPHQTIQTCVEEVVDQVLYYNGAPAMTTYFASCNNSTNTAQEVWGNYVPYLVSVASAWDSTVASNWEVRRTINQPQMESIINRIYYSSIHGNPRYDEYRHAEWAFVEGATSNRFATRVRSYVTYYADDQHRYVEHPSVPGIYFVEKANDVGIPIRSPNFVIGYNHNYTWTITTYGYGHGVGMSQWGAYGYATRSGWNYVQILEHYYPGTNLVTVD